MKAKEWVLKEKEFEKTRPRFYIIRNDRRIGISMVSLDGEMTVLEDCALLTPFEALNYAKWINETFGGE